MQQIASTLGKNILTFARSGEWDGSGNFADVMQRALDSGEKLLYLPAGVYRVDRPLLIHSNTTLTLDPEARVVAGDNALNKRGDFLISNYNKEAGDSNIAIIGGIWDGNNRQNHKSELFDENGFSGVLINFYNVTNLILRNMRLHNSSAYFTRFCKITNFIFENIGFSSDNIKSNNDGIHLNGYCENGVIRHIHALTPGSPNDDMIALNADDCVTRTENRDVVCGPIRNLYIDDIFAQDCHCFVRMLSVTAEISGIYIRNLRGGTNTRAINMDAARYCRTPLFDPNEEKYRRGVGNIFNVVYENMDILHTVDKNNSLIHIECNAKNFEIFDYSRTDTNEAVDTIRYAFIAPSVIKLYGLAQSQIDELRRDSKVTSFEVITLPDGSLGANIATEFGDTLVLKKGGFAYLYYDSSFLTPEE